MVFLGTPHFLAIFLSDIALSKSFKACLSKRHLSCSKLTIEILEQRCDICSKVTIKTLKRRQWRRFGVFIINFEHISHLCSSVSIVNFEHVIAGWDFLRKINKIMEQPLYFINVNVKLTRTQMHLGLQLDNKLLFNEHAKIIKASS